jgi:hypothetical protein
MVRTFFFVLGFLLMVFSFSYFIMCLNVFSNGYSFSIIVNFIIRSSASYLLVIGIFMVICCISIKGDKRK